MPRPHVRGVAVLNAVRFVREVYGPDRHDAVVLISTPELRAEVSEARCRLDGQPVCETRVAWHPARP